MSIWFPDLVTDWVTFRQPQLTHTAFVVKAPSHGRMVITAANALAAKQGIHNGMTLADAKAILPGLQMLDDKPALINKLLKRIAEWCIRFTPIAAVDPPDGIILDVTGCSHLWGGDGPYLNEIIKRFKTKGYHVRAPMADTIGAAWAIARFGQSCIIPPGQQAQAILSLPASYLVYYYLASVVLLSTVAVATWK